MQFGVEIPGFKWSPVQYLYKEWAGLYQEKNQYLYVNRGLGFIGYPGRVGILPEITVIELRRCLMVQKWDLPALRDLCTLGNLEIHVHL